jgi:localization factor PodJL
MLKYRFTTILILLVFLFTLSGCAGVVNSFKTNSAEETGNREYQKKDYEKAFTSYKAAAELGGSYGQFMLANMYLSGEGVKRNPSESLRWMKQSADDGYPPANYLMGRAALARNPVTAIEYFKKAAAKEHGSSMYMLGLMYAGGIGVQASQVEALRWFRMAKAQGIPVEDQLLSEAGIKSYMKHFSKRTAQSMQARTDKKEMVREVQQILAQLGYNPGPADGVYGGKTRLAIQEFQRKNSLEADGLATADILKRLKAAQ